MTLIVPELLKQSFKIATTGTIAEGAKLNMQVTPAEIQCNNCGKISSISFKETDSLTGLLLFKCKFCDSTDTKIIKGRSATVKNIKIETD